MKKLLTTILLLTLVFAAGFAAQEPQQATESKETIASPSYIITYFHFSRRCVSCMKIDAYTKEVFEESFKDKATFISVNVDEPQNKHFIQDYKLYSQSVVLRKMVGGKQEKFLVVPNVWELLGDKNSFKANIKGSVEAFMK